jgi:asparagine synthetase B (glutamine-hydrolysing)
LYVGRDFFGRRSLLWSRHENILLFSSIDDLKVFFFDHNLFGFVYIQHEWHELQSGAIHILDLSSVDIWQTCQSYSLDRQFGDWDRQFTTFEHFPIHRWLPLCKLNRCNSSNQFDTDIIIDKFIDHLSIALATRLVNANVKGVGILFSGGVDSLLIAAITNRLLDSQTTIDLINVAFDRDGNDYHRVPDRITGINAYQALIDATPSRHYRFIEVNVDRSELQNCRQTSIRRLLSPTITVLDDSIGCVLWFGARGAGCLYPTKTPYR